MGKKYIIEIDTQVKGEGDIDNLNKKTTELTERSDKLTESAKKQSIAITALGNTYGDALTSIRNWGAEQFKAAKETTIGSAAIRMLIARLLGLSSALIAVTAAVIVYRGATSAIKDFIASNIEAQREMERLAVSTTAFTMAAKRLSIELGSFFFHFKRGFLIMGDWIKREILLTNGLNAFLIAADYAHKIQRKLNEEREKAISLVQDLTFESNDLKRIIDDETKSITERNKAIAEWLKAQLAILTVQAEIIKLEAAALRATQDKSQETRDALEVLDRQLEANKNARKGVILETWNMVDSLREYIKLLRQQADDEAAARDKAAEEAWFQHRIDMYEKDKAALIKRNAFIKQILDDEVQLWKDALEEIDELDIDESDLEPGAEELANIARFENLLDYKEFLGEQLIEMGGMWGGYFELLKSFYDRDVKWTDLQAEDKKTIILGTAQATLNVADQLISQLAEGASQDFETQKKYQIAGATVQMLQGMVAAFAGAMQLGPIAGPIVGGILAAAVGAMGLANIANIKKTKPEGGTVQGNIGMGAVNTAAPSFDLIQPATSGEQGISNALNQDNDIPPTQAFVVSEQVESGSALDRNIKANATV